MVQCGRESLPTRSRLVLTFALRSVQVSEIACVFLVRACAVEVSLRHEFYFLT